jgi:hypothetical protein
MDMNTQAQMYLNAFFSNAEFPGGISFRTALNKSNLDVTWESLDRVDYLLDQIRGKIKPEFGPFLNEPANQNFLYFLCFYVGHVISTKAAKPVRWLSYQDMIREIPDNRLMFPECFQTSATCITSVGFFVPLRSITCRLFEELGEFTSKSVRLSAEGNSGKTALSNK